MDNSSLLGQRFGKLVVTSFAGYKLDNRGRKIRTWNCKCDCGNEKVISHVALKYGSTKSCGCLKHGRILTGERFGRLLVLEEAPSRQRKDRKGVKKFWKCQCDCGNITEVSHELLVDGHTKSCGCYKKEGAAIIEKFKNYHSIQTDNPRLYKTWRGMKNRCNLPTDQHHKNYYDRGIKVCDEWNNSFEAFYKWAIENGYTDELTIERVNVNGDYEPKNCIWIPMSEQCHNTTKTKYWKVGGTILRTDQIEHIFGIKQGTFLARVSRYGYTPDEAAFTPVRYGGRRKTE